MQVRWSGVAGLVALVLAACQAGARADHGPGRGGGGGMATASVPGAAVSAGVATPATSMFGSGPIVVGPATPGPGGLNYAPPIYYVPTPQGWMPYAPPLMVIAPGGGFPAPPPPPVPVEAGPLPADPAPVVPAPRRPGRAPKRGDPARAAELVKLGDRHFRAKDYAHASGRYEQALKADPGSGMPRVRLAQVAIARGQYREAVLRLREAQAAEPGWLAFPDDAQSLYREPTDFAAMLGRLETHLQRNPEDRDAWLILGVQLFLSGRTAPAADVFLRLTDREPDPVLAAFLTAARADPAGPAR